MCSSIFILILIVYTNRLNKDELKGSDQIGIEGVKSLADSFANMSNLANLNINLL